MITERALGPYKYQHETRGRGQHRINWYNSPPEGTILVSKDGTCTYVVDEIGIAGMIYATDSTGFQNALLPQEVDVKQEAAVCKSAPNRDNQ